MDAEEFRAKMSKKRSRRMPVAQAIPATGDELRKLLEPGSLETQCRDAGLPEPVAEFRFDAVRRWRFDFCWPELMVACEVDGGIYTEGRHTRGAGFEKDMEKLNAAAAAGYCVLRFTPDQVKTRVAINELEPVLRARMEKP